MTGLFLKSNDGAVVHVSLPDGEGSAVVNGRTWRWSFHRYLGPTFLKVNGDPIKRTPSEDHPVWDAFGKWMDNREEQGQ